MDSGPNKVKHLEIIQAVIERMAGNLFLLKGWAITLIAALFAVSAQGSNKSFFLIAYIPAIVFWGLDGYFLSHERRFRSLYDEVRKKNEDQIDFSMDIRPFAAEDRNSWLAATFSVTLFLYYGAVIGAMAIVMVLID